MMSDFSFDTESDEVYDVVIIGGGPAGLSAAIYAARANLKTVVLDKSSTAGALSMTHKMENYPGVPQAISGKELLSLFHQQAESFGAQIIQAQVFGVNFAKEPKEVIAADKIYKSKAVIIATGSMGHKPRLKGEAEFIGKGVSYCGICDAAFYKGKPVAVIGEPPDVFAELEIIAKYASKIYLFLKGRAPSAEQIERVHRIPTVEVMNPKHLVGIVGNEFVEGVTTLNAAGSQELMDVDGVFVYLHGNMPIVDFLGQQIDITPKGCIKVNQADMSTSIEGVYAIGDVICKEIRQVVIAAAEGCTAALSVDKYINQRQQLRSQWS
ncbi:FAD-dependent oxidoreductase [Nodosilinea sp. LEGE 07088]|uniref:NAD(P)/FAD-dependent oxidoreductase n=1 Tax=Nodosilinea sp. LEGE 07088 TaxID=2777968 RepID=UPI00187E0E59|nr:FAD-dependent oxidoreductase [Nodosilinea sp. LEGE 07088]MBE9136440.1 FAD-dependent oxidoreductase [Nodosilinea sp. LEGE 07088]